MVAGAGQLRSETLELHKGSDKELVVFVHGLFGDTAQTFGNWPKLMAGDKRETNGRSLSRFHIVSLGYPAGFGGTLTPVEISRNLRSELARYVADRKIESIHIVAHSLGGIVAQRLLLDAADDSPQLYNATASLFLIASPVRGAPLANYSAIRHLTRLANRLVEWLPTVDDNRFLADQETKWDNLRSPRNTRARFELFCIVETKDHPILRTRIVPDEFTARPCDDKWYANGKDHEQVVKPDTIDDPVFDWVRKGILRRVVPKTVPAIEAASKFCRMEYGALRDRGYCATVMEVRGDRLSVRLDQVIPVQTIGRDLDGCTANTKLRDLVVGRTIEIARACVPAPSPELARPTPARLPIGKRFCRMEYGVLKDRGYCATVVSGAPSGVVLRIDTVQPVRTVGRDLDECTANRRLMQLQPGMSITVPSGCVPP